MKDIFEFTRLLRYLRRQHPILWSVLSTLAVILRSAVRTCAPIYASFFVFRELLEEIVFEENQALPHWVTLVTAAIVMTVMIAQDNRWKYAALSARGGIERPSVWHDMKVVFGSGIYWITAILSAATVFYFADYLAEVFTFVAPDSLPLQTLSAALLPAVGIVLYETVVFFVTLRVWYRTVPAEEPLAEPQLPSTFRMVIQLFVWALVLLLSPFAAWVIVVSCQMFFGLLRKYIVQALIGTAVIVVVVTLHRLLRAWRVRSRCVRQLRQELGEACIHFEFEKHPIRSAFYGGEKISLRVFIGDRVILVRMVPFYARFGTLIVTPDGNVGQLHRITIGKVALTPRFGAVRMGANTAVGRGKMGEGELAEWITKRDTVFEDEEHYPGAEKVYLISPTPKFWVAGDLRAMAPLDNGSRAYGYTLWTTTAFCRQMRMLQEDALRGR